MTAVGSCTSWRPVASRADDVHGSTVMVIVGNERELGISGCLLGVSRRGEFKFAADVLPGLTAVPLTIIQKCKKGVG